MVGARLINAGYHEAGAQRGRQPRQPCASSATHLLAVAVLAPLAFVLGLTWRLLQLCQPAAVPALPWLHYTNPPTPPLFSRPFRSSPSS
ncbi:hypothetical protein ACP70R_026374 [Stipagrostis hirtigluma subsp. patula]